MRREFLLGLFILIGIIIGAVLVFTIRDIKLEPGYILHIYFDDTAGLPDKAKVRIAGVTVGWVREISYEEGKAKVTVWIRRGVKIYRNAKATIQMRGLLGIQFLAIEPGTPETGLLKHNDKIYGITPVSINEAISQVMSNIQKLSDMLTTATGGLQTENINNIVSNLNAITRNLNKADIAGTIENINKISTELSELIKETKPKVQLTISNIEEASKKISSSETPVGKLLTDKELAKDLSETVSSFKTTSEEAKKVLARFTLIKTYWDYTLRYESRIHNDIGISIYPKPNKFYHIGVSNISEKNKATEAPHHPYGAIQESPNTLNLLLGKRFGDLTIYGGAIRSTAGVGLNYIPFPNTQILKNVSVSTELFDMLREKNPQLTLSLSAKIIPYLLFGVRCEDLLYKTRYMASLRIFAEDEDIAYLLSLAGLAGLAK